MCIVTKPPVRTGPYLAAMYRIRAAVETLRPLTDHVEHEHYAAICDVRAAMAGLCVEALLGRREGEKGNG